MKKGIYLLFALFLSGCSFPATKEGMIVTDYRAPKQTGDRIFVKRSTGGSITLPFWGSKISDNNFTEAVKASLLESNAFSVLSSNWGEEWGLEIDIRNVDQPIFGLDFTVTTTVRYVLFLKSKKVYEIEVIEAGRETVAESLAAVKRLRVANEKSARANIRKFIQELSNQKFN